MTKQINYLLIAEELTGDSTVKFFPTPELAEKAFKKHTNPLIQTCIDAGADENNEDVFYSLKDGKAYRFNYGILDELDDQLNECNQYVEWNTITVNNDVTHYIAQFSEWVDDSSINFYPQQTSIISLHSLINEQISIAKEHHNITIDPQNSKTWKNTEGQTLYLESTDFVKNQANIFFGYSDVYLTIQHGQIQ